MKEKEISLFQLPRGVKVLSPRAAHRREWVREVLLNTFRAWGFQRVITPTFEYLDILLKGLEEGLEDRLYKLVERETGRLVALRPDFTPQVARIAATVMRDYPRPLRLCYSGGVFRHMPREEEREIYQVGVELIGLDLPEADAEMIAMAARALENLGLTGYRISVGHMGLIRELLKAVPSQAVSGIMEALVRKDRMEMARIARGLTSPWQEVVRAFPTLYGGEEVLEKARELLGDHGNFPRHLDYLKTLYSMVEVYGLAHHVVLDLSEIRGFQYHTGMVFEIFVEGLGKKVGGGGRYDFLLARFGKDEPATGFGINVDAVLKALEQGVVALPTDPIHYLLVDFSRDKREALTLARRLRELGWRVARDIIRRDLKGSLEYARKMGIEALIVMDDELKREGKVRLIRFTKEKEEDLSMESLLFPKGGDHD